MTDSLHHIDRRALGLADSETGAEVKATPRGAQRGRSVAPATAKRLVGQGLALERDGRLRITRKGREVLNRPVKGRDTPVFLRVRDGLTASRHNAVLDAGEVIDPGTLEPWWVEQSERQRAAARDRRVAARRLARSVRKAA